MTRPDIRSDDAFATAAALPPINGILIRHLRAPTDYPAMNTVANRARVANGDHFATSDDGLAAFYDHLPDSDPATDVVVVTVAEAIVAYGRVTSGAERSEDRGHLHDVICFVDPAWTRRGIGRALLATLEARAGDMAADQPNVAHNLQAEAEDTSAGQTALLVSAGYGPVRYFYTMLRPNLDDQLDAPLPAGLEIRDVQPEHLRAIWETEMEAIQDHWGATEPTEAAYKSFLTDASPAETALWRIAWDGDQIVGQVRSFISDDGNHRDGTTRGWVERIMVRRPWRHRGVARALMAASFPLLRARGMTEGILGVDTENPSGALRVYESMGFAPISRGTTYRKPIG